MDTSRKMQRNAVTNVKPRTSQRVYLPILSVGDINL